MFILTMSMQAICVGLVYADYQYLKKRLVHQLLFIILLKFDAISNINIDPKLIIFYLSFKVPFLSHTQFQCLFLLSFFLFRPLLFVFISFSLSSSSSFPVHSLIVLLIIWDVFFCWFKEGNFLRWNEFSLNESFFLLDFLLWIFVSVLSFVMFVE